MKLPRLQNLYWYACALVGAGFLILGGMLIYHSLMEVRRLSTSQDQLERLASVIALANSASAERVPVIGAVRAAPEAQDSYTQRIQAQRQQTNESLQAVAEKLVDEIAQDTTLAGLLHRFQ